MATGDVPNIISRLRAVLPPWFPSVAPILNGVLTGFATCAAFIYSLYGYAKSQTRIKTANGAWLELIAWDYLGPTFGRRTGESDTSYQSRILTFLLLPRNTLPGITSMLLALTGRQPAITEAGTNSGCFDTGGFDYSGLAGSTLTIIAFRPPGQGIPNAGGFDGVTIGGFDVGSLYLADMSQVTGQVTDAEITTRVRQWVAAGVNYTLNISS